MREVNDQLDFNVDTPSDRELEEKFNRDVAAAVESEDFIHEKNYSKSRLTDHLINKSIKKHKKHHKDNDHDDD